MKGGVRTIRSARGAMYLGSTLTGLRLERSGLVGRRIIRLFPNEEQDVADSITGYRSAQP